MTTKITRENGKWTVRVKQGKSTFFNLKAALLFAKAITTNK